MPKTIRLISLLIIAIFSMSVFSAAAQSDFSAEDLETLSYVNSAISDTIMLDSYSSEGNVSITQTINTVVGEMESTLNQDIQQTISAVMERTDDGVTADMTVEQDIITAMPDGTETPIRLTMDMIVLDDTLYVQFRDLDNEMLGDLYPEGWINLTEDPAAFMGAETINAEQFINILQGINVPLDETTVSDFEEIEGEEIDGQLMRVFEIEFDMQGLFETDAMAQAMNAVDLSSLGIDMNTIYEQMAQNSEMSYTVWIGTEDNLLHRAESTMNSNLDLTELIPGSDELLIDQEVRSAITYGEFNEDFEITAPDL